MHWSDLAGLKKQCEMIDTMCESEVEALKAFGGITALNR